jgi:ribulose-phosphate 3-epimerase
MTKEKKIIISPSILSADFSRLAEDMKALGEAGCDTIHADVMDGAFVPNISFGQAVLRHVAKAAPVPLDVHLMIEEPGRFIEEFAIDNVASIAVHPEACTHLDRVLRQIREAGKSPAVAINPATPLSSIEWVLELVDLVVIMTVNPGFGGQKFIAGMLPKIEQLRSDLDRRGLSVTLGIDGGVTDQNVATLVRAGADYFVMGNYLFTAAEGIAGAVRKVRGLCAAE